MFEFHGRRPPSKLAHIEIGGPCPHCKIGTTFIRTTEPIYNRLSTHSAGTVVIDYICSVCRKSIPVQWLITGNDQKDLIVDIPQSVLPLKAPFDFDSVPDPVRKEIEEALDCLSVNAYNGFAAVCRRSMQAISTNLGADATSRVQHQVENMLEIADLDDEWKEITKQILLSGHDGAHPHLPEMDHERSEILLSLLQDLTYQLYTRPGKVKRAAELRKQAIEKKAAE
jgi:hypothetical protein